MAKYRKKPVVVEAFQVLGEIDGRFKYHPEWPQWAEDAWNADAGSVGEIYYDPRAEDGVVLTMETLRNGKVNIYVNDWVIKHVNGELYTCKPDIFESTYEKVKELSHG